jgi:hypothetical protein
MDAFDVAGWPRTRWELSAAESYALLYGPKISEPAQPLKLAVLELLSRRVFSLTELEKAGIYRKKKIAILRISSETTDNHVLRAVRSLYISCGQSSYTGGMRGVEVKRLAQQASREYGGQKGFFDAVVMPSLADQGFFVLEQRTFLGFTLTEYWKLTGSALEARSTLTASMRLGESQFGGWVDRQPNQAIAFLGMMGPAILLIKPLYPELRRLREQYATSGAGGASGAPNSAQDREPSDDHAAGPGALDLAGLDLARPRLGRPRSRCAQQPRRCLRRDRLCRRGGT